MKLWEFLECPNVWKIIDLLLAPVDEGLHEIDLLILRGEPVILALMDMGRVCGGVVVLGSNWIGVGVDKDHVVVNGEKKLVSMVG